MSKIGRQCTVCQHRELAGINLGLARGVSVRALATRYRLHRDALYRHAKNHLPPQLRASLIAGPDLDIDLDKLRETESQSLLANLVNLRGRLFSSLDVAEEAGDGNMLARVAGQLHNNLEITGKLLGSLSSGHSSVTNILIQPQYVPPCASSSCARWRPSLRRAPPSLRSCTRSKAKPPLILLPTRGSSRHEHVPRSRARPRSGHLRPGLRHHAGPL